MKLVEAEALAARGGEQSHRERHQPERQMPLPDTSRHDPAITWNQEHFQSFMSLEEYVKKRDFRRTPEPKPEKVSKSPSHGGRFFIQTHNATRLHYDCRLESDGTWKSWAGPKGPSLDPSVKRLAAMGEDHPLDCGDFEDNIP